MNPATLEIQESLSALGYDPGDHDGIMGPLTQAALDEFTSDQGMEQPSQSEAIERLLAERARFEAGEPEPVNRIIRVGAWVWGRDLTSRADEAVERADRIGLSDVDLFVTPDKRGRFEPRLSPEQVAELGNAYAERGIDVHVTYWAYSSSEYLSAMANHLYATLGLLPSLQSVTLDTEHALTRAYRRDKTCVNRIAQHLQGLRLPVAVTGYGFATSADEALCHALIAYGLEVVTLGQGYSVPYITRGGTRIHNPAAYRPRVAQRNCARSWPNTGARVMGLACYKNPPEGWIEQCVDESEKLGFRHVRFWDLASMTGRIAAEMARVCTRASLARKAVLG